MKILSKNVWSIQRDICFVTHISFWYTHILAWPGRESKRTTFHSNLCFMCSILYKMNYFLRGKNMYVYCVCWKVVVGLDIFYPAVTQSWVPNPIVKTFLILSIFNYKFLLQVKYTLPLFAGYCTNLICNWLKVLLN